MRGYLLDTNIPSENTADGLIAATALEHDLSLVTRNSKDFAGLGVQIINPWEL